MARSLENAKLRRYVERASRYVFAGERLTVSTAPAWNLDALTLAALYYHPDVAAARAHLRAVQAGEVTAGEIPNPSVAWSPSISSNPGEQNPWTLGFTFDIPIETAGKPQHRMAQAKANTRAARMDLALAAWQVRSRLRAALIEEELNREIAGALEQEVAARQHYVALLEARLKAGEAGRPEVDVARIDLLTARQALVAAQGQLAESRTALAAAVGVPTGGLDGARFAIPTIVDASWIDAEKIRAAGLLNRLDVRRALAEYEAAEAALRLEVARQYPDLHIGPGYTFDQGQNKWELGVSLTLPIFNQNAGAIAEARAHRDELAAKFLALQARVIAQTESALARYQAAARELEQADGQLAASRRQFDAVESGFKLGQEDRLALTGAQVQLHIAERLRVDAARKAQLALAGLEDAVQRPVVSAGAATAPASQPSEESKP